jgi:hypothetical protein
MWPIDAMNKLVWITRPTRFFDVYSIIGSFSIFAAMISFSRFMSLPFNMVSVAAGLALPTPICLSMTIGLLAGRAIARVAGKEWYSKYKVTIAAGASLGEALAIVIGVTIALVVKSVFARPY